MSQAYQLLLQIRLLTQRAFLLGLRLGTKMQENAQKAC